MKPDFQGLIFHWRIKTLKQLNVTQNPIKLIYKHTIYVQVELKVEFFIVFTWNPNYSLLSELLYKSSSSIWLQNIFQIFSILVCVKWSEAMTNCGKHCQKVYKLSNSFDSPGTDE